ncbi:MAG: hypothetical protein WB420_23835 [Bradyrhizobium sp.]
MNLPDAAAADDFRISEQTTHGESNREHFSGKTIPAKVPGGPATTSQILPTAGQMLPKAPACPVSAQPGKKLMQKIHSLTDN